MHNPQTFRPEEPLFSSTIGFSVSGSRSGFLHRGKARALAAAPRSARIPRPGSAQGIDLPLMNQPVKFVRQTHASHDFLRKMQPIASCCNQSGTRSR